MKPEIKYGLLAGGGVCLWTTLEYLLGFHTTRPAIGEYSGYFSTVIPLVAVFILLQRKQAAAYDGRLTLAQGINSGIATSFLAALVVCTFLFAYNRFINPNWLDGFLDWKVAQLRVQGVAEVAIRKEIVSYRQANSPIGLVAITLCGMPLIGAVFSLALTLALRLRVRPGLS